jgi:anti-sigma regulatory factor (Ser/Thr protein kinase)
MCKYIFSFPSTELSLKVSDDIFGILINNLDIPDYEKYRLKVVVSELFVNAYLHGNGAEPGKYIDVIIELNETDVIVTVKDQGNGLSLEKFKQHAGSLPESSSEHGRGINIAKRFGDKIDLFKDPDGKFCIRFARRLNNIKKASDLVGG